MDNTPPASHVLALSPTESSADFTIQWTGSDIGAGIRTSRSTHPITAVPLLQFSPTLLRHLRHSTVRQVTPMPSTASHATSWAMWREPRLWRRRLLTFETVIAGVKQAMKPANVEREPARRRSEIATLDQEIGRLTEAIAVSSTPLPTLLEALQARQRRRDELIVVEAWRSAAAARRSALLRRTYGGSSTNGGVADTGRLATGGSCSVASCGVPSGSPQRARCIDFLGRRRSVGCLAGVVPTYLASLTIPSWNQIASFLASMRELRDSAGFAG